MIKETTDRSLSNNESDQRFMQLKVLKKEKKKALKKEEPTE